jgi:hypothetical protein
MRNFVNNSDKNHRENHRGGDLPAVARALFFGLACSVLATGCGSSNSNPKPAGSGGVTGSGGRGTTGTGGAGSGGTSGGSGGSADGTGGGGAVGGSGGNVGGASGGGAGGTAGAGGVTGGRGGSAGSASGGAGGAASGGGGGTASGGTSGSGGAGGGQPGCLPGKPADRASIQFLNKCTGSNCFPFNNTVRVPNWNGGALPPL